jgi:selenium metabolism protein YedF
MNEHTVDARTLKCPQPLMMAKKALEGMSAGERLRVQIDNETARDNLMRFLRDNGMTPVLSSEGGVYTIAVEKVLEAAPLGDTEAYCAPDRPQTGPVIVLNHNGMGSGSEELGRVLLQACVFTLKDISPLPSVILCYNAGVLVAAEGAPTVPALADLVRRGVTLLLCGTCVDYYELKGKIAVGTISNMYEILQRVSTSERVITL